MAQNIFAVYILVRLTDLLVEIDNEKRPCEEYVLGTSRNNCTVPHVLYTIINEKYGYYYPGKIYVLAHHVVRTQHESSKKN